MRRALLRAERYSELYDVLQGTKFWSYKRWAVKALAAQGRRAEAIELAEASRGPWTSESDLASLCEEILLSSGMAEEAYRRYGLSAHRAGTNLATFRAISKRYPSIEPARILTDLVDASSGEEGKWFATAKEVGLYQLALELVKTSPCDPKTLARAARDFAVKQPAFAQGAGFAALHWLVRGYGYDVTSLDVWTAYEGVLKAAEQLGTGNEAKDVVRNLVTGEAAGGFVRQILGRELGIGD